MLTKKQVIKEALERGERLTVAEAMSKYNIYTLREIIRDLKKEGMPIDYTRESCINTYGSTSVYKRWFLSEPVQS